MKFIILIIIILLNYGCDNQENKNFRVSNDTINLNSKSKYQDSIPPRITLGGPVNNYISSIGKKLLESRNSQNFDNEEVYHKLLFSEKKEFMSKDSVFLTIIVQYPIVALIKSKNPNNITDNLRNNRKEKKIYKYGIFRNSKLYILDLTNPGLNFTDDCCQLKYNAGVLTEESPNTKVVYHEIK